MGVETLGTSLRGTASFDVFCVKIGARVSAVAFLKNQKNSRVTRGAKSRMRRTESPKPNWIKFCLVVDIPDTVTYRNFGDHRLRGFWVAGGQISPSPIDFHRRPYNTLAFFFFLLLLFVTLFISRRFLRSVPDRDIINTPLEPLRPADVPFGGFVDIVPHFRGEMPQKPRFWGMDRRFQAKRAKYCKFYVIETTALILTKFCITIDTTKWSSRVVPVGAQQIQDGGRPPFKTRSSAIAE